MNLPNQLKEKAEKIRLVVFDVDGVLTDGTLVYGSNGEDVKHFNVKDGVGIKLLNEFDISVAIISAKESAPLKKRISDLGIKHSYLACKDKEAALQELLTKLQLDWDEVAFCGDDVIDLKAMKFAGLSICPNDAYFMVRDYCDYVTQVGGGKGVAREVCDVVLSSKMDLEEAYIKAMLPEFESLRNKMTDYKIVIPARYGSSRLPGKPLIELAGKPMVQHVYERALEAGVQDVVIATDDQRIFDKAEAFGARVVMTLEDHENGTERIAEVAEKMGWKDEDVIVNLQGDEPLIPKHLIKLTADGLLHHPNAGMSSLCTPIDHEDDAFDPNVVKAVLDNNGFALYFSRAPIPWDRDHYKVDNPVYYKSCAGLSSHRHVRVSSFFFKGICKYGANPA